VGVSHGDRGLKIFFRIKELYQMQANGLSQVLTTLTLYKISKVNGKTIITDHYGFPVDRDEVLSLIDACKSALELSEEERAACKKHFHEMFLGECKENLADVRRKVLEYVYVIEAVGTGLYKIGLTTNPRGRLKKLRGQYSSPLVVHILIPSQDIYSLEKQLHHQFQDKQMTGEWFALSVSDLQSIQALNGNALPEPNDRTPEEWLGGSK
jgi:hypothetical protein